MRNTSINMHRAGGLTKAQIRSKIILKLKTQKEESRKRKSKIIKNRLFRTKVFQQAKIAMFYMSFDGEVDTKEMIKEAQNLGKIIAIPVCHPNRMSIKPCKLDAQGKLGSGPYGICEPAKKKFMRAKELDLVIVPGIAFDKKGNRLGRGRGCYDRFLKKLPQNIPSIGLAFAFQILPSLPATPTDVNVDRVIFA